MQPDDNLADIDTRTASGARAYDYVLGGSDNYVVDRMAIEEAERRMPGTKALLRNNRRYLERVVTYLVAECGIRQFIDNGSGLPTANNVHQIAQAIDPSARVLYIDKDPVVLRHQKVSALAENDRTGFVLADATRVEDILAHPEAARLIDPDEPAAALYLSFLHFIPDESGPWAMVAGMMGRLAPGSYLAVSQAVSDSPDVRREMNEFAQGRFRDFGRIRRRREVREFFAGLEMVPPGTVNVNAWHPDGREEEQSQDWTEYGGVGRTPPA